MDDAHRYLEAAKRGGPVRFEWRRRNRDGSLHWDEVCLKAATIAGRPHILAFTREITERKAALEALQQREEQYREIFTASADALTLWNQDLRIVDVNPAFLRIYGFRREQVVDAGYPAHFPRDYVEDRLQMVRRALAGESSELHTRAYRADGTHFEVELRVIPVRHRGQPHVLAISRDITERRQREEALRASEARYRLLFEMESDAITLADADSLRIIDANRAALQMYGYTREEMLRQTWHQLSVEPTLTAAAVPPGTGTISVPLRRHRRKDGSEFLVEATLTYFELDSRRFELTVIRDISERVARERELRASEARLRATVEAAFDCVIGMDGDGRIIEFNAAAERCFGYTRDQVLGRPLADKIIPPDQRAAHTAGLARYRVSGDGPYLNRRIETVAMRADGTEFPVELAIAAAQGMQDRIFVGYLRDITARKHAEQALRASEEQYRAIFNASADALVLRDADFRIVDVNPAYSQLSGYTREEALGATRVLSQTDAETELRRQQHARVLAGEPLRFETTATRKDGVRVDVEVRARPVQYRGRPHVLYIARDITAARQAEAQRSALEAQLRQAQKMEALGQLTGGIAHDFNNILASIMGYVVLAAERAQAAHDTKTAGYLENSLDSCRRARDLIQQMLTFSRGRRGERQPLKLCELVQEAAPLLRSSLPSTIAFELDCDRTAAPVLADEVQVGQILLNLCINARDAMHGSGRLVISVRPTSARRAVCASCRAGFGGEFVELAVRDTGTGIEPHVLERMFEPFFSTKEVGKGSGMGLATVHGIVHEHGGHLQVDTEPGAGTTFRVLLPALDAERSRHAPDAPSPDIAVARRLLRGRALLVDDEQAVRHFMTELLHGWGLDVTAAADADEARAAFARADGEFDLVITDQTMPRATGVALAAELHAQRPALPILLYSGRADALPDELPAHGIRAVLDKPIDVSALRRAVEAALDQRPSVTSEL
jgi:PAS domain S-box-containing protein